VHSPNVDISRVDDSEPRQLLYIQGEIIGFQVLLDSLHPCFTRAFWSSPSVLQGTSC